MITAQPTRLATQLDHATSYAQWLEIAQELARITATTPNATKDRLRTHSRHIEILLGAKNWPELMLFLRESLYQTMGELADPQLYQDSLLGPQEVEDYLDQVTKALATWCEQSIPGYSNRDKLTLLIQAERNFGRPALMLSGGGTFGIYHVGVVRALLHESLLPEVICGTSMGSIAAGILAVRTDQELKAFLASPEKTNYHPLKRLPIKRICHEMSLLDHRQLAQCVSANIGHLTFSEAFQKTGREVNITVSPTRTGQKPRILNHQTAPEVLINSAAKASCSVPGLFPACRLQARAANAEIVDYLPQEQWVDGSFATDIPRQRIARLHNVNYFIVSQANPHVLPFVKARQQSGVTGLVKDIVTTSVVSESRALLKLAQRRLHRQPWRSWLDHASMMLDQDYLGDINIHPQFPTRWAVKFMKNPTLDELQYLIRSGEQATWPQLKRIDHQTRISKTLRKCIKQLKLLDAPSGNTRTEGLNPLAPHSERLTNPRDPRCNR